MPPIIVIRRCVLLAARARFSFWKYAFSSASEENSTGVSSTDASTQAAIWEVDRGSGASFQQKVSVTLLFLAGGQTFLL